MKTSSIRRITNRKIRIPIHIKLFKNGELIHSSTFTKKSKALRCIQVRSWDKAYLKVTYDRKFYNDGIYEKNKDFKEALAAFTEKSLLDFVETN